MQAISIYTSSITDIQQNEPFLPGISQDCTQYCEPLPPAQHSMALTVRKKDMSLKELVNASKESREDHKSIPEVLLNRIKVRPPQPRTQHHAAHAIIHQSHIKDFKLNKDQSVAFDYSENHNHHPNVFSINNRALKEKFAQTDSRVVDDEEEKKIRSLTFKQKLVDYLVDQRNQKSKSENSSETAEMLLMSVDNEFFPRQLTGHGIWTDVEIDDQQLSQAFYNYFLNTIKSHAISHMSNEKLQVLLDRIPQNLIESFPNLVEQLLNEIRDDFSESSKNSAVQHILTKPVLIKE
ncbi:hypothetical protein HK096_000542, partial [Nowakowskiella sp. JEL0078]